ncbi:MAG: hypothetical protein KDD84_02690 [Caldilineaceae bacterium]|nr:hypothetical protein [Caldilineaceae bacterium]
MPTRDEVIALVREAFAEDIQRPLTTSLRAGNAIDEYRIAPPFDSELDAPTDAYLEANFWGIAHLDPASWRHYLPRLIEYVCRRQDAENVGDALFSSLRPPDHDPPRFGSLTAEQEAAVITFLDCFAFSAESPYAADAQLALEEWWAPGALYRR